MLRKGVGICRGFRVVLQVYHLLLLLLGEFQIWQVDDLDNQSSRFRALGDRYCDDI